MARSTWGSIRSKSKGVWEVRYTVGGRRKSETVRGTRKQAEQRRAELQVEFGPLGPGPGTGITVQGCWTRYYRPHVERHKAPATLDGYESAYSSRIGPAFGDRVMESVRPAEIQEWLDGMTYGAARKAFAVLRAMYNWAEDKELVSRNVMAKRYEMPRRSDGGSRAVCEDVHDLTTLKSVFEDCRGEVWEAGYICSAFGGLRRCEAFGVRLDGVEYFPPGSEGSAAGFAVVEVRRSVQRIKGRVVVSETLKTDGSRGVAVVPDPYASRLAEIAEERRGDVWLMDDGFGEPIDPEVLASAYKRWFQRSPYRYIPWKNLRNSYATMLHEAGVELGVIAKVLRHTTPMITYKHYDKPSIGMLAEAVSKIG